MRIEVVPTVAEFLHEFRRRVSNMEWHGILGKIPHVGGCPAVTGVNGVALLRKGEVDARLGKGQIALRGAEEVEGLHGGNRYDEGLRVCVAHILGSKAGHAPRDVERVLPRLHHPREPVEGRIGIGAPHALVEGAYEIVMHLPFLVVDKHPFLVGFLHHLVVDDTARARSSGRRGRMRPPAG